MPEKPSIDSPTAAEAALEQEVSSALEIALPVPDTETEAFLDIVSAAWKSKDFSQFRESATNLLGSHEFWIDLGLILLTVIIARIIYGLFEAGKITTLQKLFYRIPSKQKLRPFRVSLVIVTWLTLLVANLSGLSCPFLRTYSLILTWFFFINLPSKFIHWKSWMSVVSTILFAVVALHVLGLLDDTVVFLDKYSLDLGSASISSLDVIKGLSVFLILFWAAGLVSRIISNRISNVQDLEPNVKILFTKGIRIGLFFLSILIAMGVMGLKITTLTVFGGALGLGLGFGLQKVISNLVSGIILLLDKSIKPGDVIEIGQTYGWVNSLNLRYASVITRDNKEHLIPNEDLITLPVINWSYSSKLIRIRAPFGISYRSDVRLAMKLAEDCAKATDRVVSSPVPRCNLMGFGDSSVDFELRFWIEDPHNGIGAVRSNVLLSIWDAFHENGIEFPFPQRDVNLRIVDKDIRTSLLDPQKQTDKDT